MTKDIMNRFKEKNDELKRNGFFDKLKSVKVQEDGETESAITKISMSDIRKSCTIKLI